MHARCVDQRHPVLGALQLLRVLIVRRKETLIEEPHVATVGCICDQNGRVLFESVLCVEIERHVVHYQLIFSLTQ